MALNGGPATQWKQAFAPSPARLIALVGTAGGVCTLLAAIFPATDAAPVDTYRVIGAIALIGALAIFLIGERMPKWGLHLAVAMGSVGIAVAISQTPTALGMIVTASAYLWVCIYAGFFFSLPAARLHMAWIAIIFGAALLVGDAFVPVNAWAFITISLFVAGEVIGRQSSRLRREAHTDALTGLLNRNGLASAARRAFALADKTDIPLTAALVDLDDFKTINDEQGHQAGDRILMELAATWADELEASDIFARLGGDEFLVLLVGWSEEETERLFERLRFASPAPWSAGVIRRRKGEDLGSCMANADRALYEAKGVRGSRWTDYRMAPELEDQGPSTVPRRRRRLARLIRRAS